MGKVIDRHHVGEWALIISTKEILKIESVFFTIDFEEIDGHFKEVIDSQVNFYVLSNKSEYSENQLIIGKENIRQKNLTIILDEF